MIDVEAVIQRLYQRYGAELERNVSDEDLRAFQEWSKRFNITGWEGWFCPETRFYDKVLELVSPDDVVYDACAGALFLSLRLSQKCRKVYAVEINPNVLGWALETIGFDMPTNLIAICGDALKMPLPPDVTKIILLHIHLEKPLPQSWRSKPIITSIGGRLRIWNPEKEEWLTLNSPSLLMR